MDKFCQCHFILYNIEYNGVYKYSIEDATILSNKLVNLKTVFPYEIEHNGKHYRYDFSCSDVHLSAKTAKRVAKICPQVIGQTTKKKFCEHFGINKTNTDNKETDTETDNKETDTETDNKQIKAYIEANVKDMMYDYTFDCPIVYYNKHKNSIKFIKLLKPVDWLNCNIVFTRQKDKWNENTTIKINSVSIGEFQIHNHRNCIKFRWCFDTLLEYFKDNFEVVVV